MRKFKATGEKPNIDASEAVSLISEQLLESNGFHNHEYIDSVTG